MLKLHEEYLAKKTEDISMIQCYHVKTVLTVTGQGLEGTNEMTHINDNKTWNWKWTDCVARKIIGPADKNGWIKGVRFGHKTNGGGNGRKNDWNFFDIRMIETLKAKLRLLIYVGQKLVEAILG